MITRRRLKSRAKPGGAKLQSSLFPRGATDALLLEGGD
jgi:hypothetical protein